MYLPNSTKKSVMVKLKKYIALFLSLSAFACSEDTVIDNKEKGCIAFIAAEDSRSTQENNKFDKGDAIGVFAFDPAEKKYWATNNKYVFDGIKFLPANTSDKIIVTNGYNLDYYIYYPYSDKQNNIENIRHESGNQNEKQSWLTADFMTAKHTGPIKDYTVPLNFRRQFSTVEVTVSRNDGANAATLHKACYSASYNLIKGTSTVSDSRMDIKMYKYSESGNTTVFRATVPPQYLSSKSNHITLSGTNDIRLQSSRDIELKPGIINPYSIEYQKDITIDDYIPGGTTTGAGLYNIGTSCTVRSTPKPGYEFAGWHEGGKLVWTGKDYTFDVLSDRTLVPHYRSYAPWSLVLDVSPTTISTGGGTANLSSSATRKIMINDKETSDTERIEYPHPSLSVTSSDPNNFRIEGRIIRVQENTTTTTRTATITASCGGVSKSVTLTQAGRTEEYIFRVNGKDEVGIAFSSEASSKTFNIVSEKTTVVDGISRTEVVGWKATSFPFGNIASDGTLTVTENPNKDDRLDTITLTQNGSGLTVRINIKQKGKNEIIIDPTK